MSAASRHGLESRRSLPQIKIGKHLPSGWPPSGNLAREADRPQRAERAH